MHRWINFGGVASSELPAAAVAAAVLPLARLGLRDGFRRGGDEAVDAVRAEAMKLGAVYVEQKEEVARAAAALASTERS